MLKNLIPFLQHFDKLILVRTCSQQVRHRPQPSPEPTDRLIGVCHARGGSHPTPTATGPNHRPNPRIA